jgi:hypothetical protein
MAISGIVYGGNQSKWGISEESTFGTAIADTGNFEMIESKIGTVDPGVFRDNTVKAGDGRMRNIANDFVSTKGSLRVISFSDMVVRHDDLGWLLYAVCQNVSEAVGTPFEKTFSLSAATSQPDFVSNAGYFFTLGIQDTLTNYDRKYTSCILRTLTLSADLGGDGLLRASGEIISGFNESTTANYNTGTWVYNAQDHFNFHVTPTKKIGGSDIVLYSFDITINNNAVRIGSTGANGDCESYALGIGDTGYEVSGNIKCKFDANVQGLFAADRAGTTTALQLACGTDGATGNFDITAASCLVQNVADDYDDARGRALDVPFIAHATTTITCSDALDRTW